MTTDSMQSSRQTTPSSGISFVSVLLIMIFAVIVGAAAMWFFAVYKPNRDVAQENRDRFMRMTGMDHPVVNTLDSRFTDADKDLIADVPTDSKLVLDPQKIIFSYIAEEEPGDTERQWKPFCDQLSR